MLSAKPRDRGVIRQQVRADHPERHILHTPTLDRPQGTHPLRIRIQHHRDHLRRIRRTTPRPRTKPLKEHRQIQLLNRVDHEQREMPRHQPIPQIRRQQQHLITINAKKFRAIPERVLTLNPARTDPARLMRQRAVPACRLPTRHENHTEAGMTAPSARGPAQTGRRLRGRDSEWDRCNAFSHRRRGPRGFTGQCRWRLAPPPLRNENLAAAGLTPARLGLVEAEGQCGAGACGTVDCCHERESQTHPWEAPTGGAHRPFDEGVRRKQVTTEHGSPGLPVGRPVFACSRRLIPWWGFTSQPL